MNGKHLQGDGTWEWLHVEVDGADIVLRNSACTNWKEIYEPEYSD